MKLFKNKNFLLLWSSQLMSSFAVNIMNFLVLINIFDKTGSTIASSFIWIAYGIPAIILGPIAAASVDLSNKRRILMSANLVQAFIILIYALLYQKFLYLSYGVVAAYSVMDQFYVPAESASLPILIKRKNLPQANGLFFLSAQSSAILGFGLAGPLKELVGFTNTMLLGSVMLVIAFLATANLPKLPAKTIGKFKNMEDRIVQHIDRMKEGFLFIRNNKQILYPFLFLIILQVYLVIIVVNLPAIGEQLVKTSSSFIGIITIVPAGIGAILGTFLVSKILALKVNKKSLVEKALLVSSISFTSVPLFIPLVNFWLGRFILITAFFVTGMAFVTALIPAITLMQINTPERLLGRVFGNFWFMAYVATLIPVLFSATITETMGVRTLLILMGAFIFSLVLYSKNKLTGVFETE